MNQSKGDFSSRPNGFFSKINQYQDDKVIKWKGFKSWVVYGNQILFFSFPLKKLFSHFEKFI